MTKPDSPCVDCGQMLPYSGRGRPAQRCGPCRDRWQKAKRSDPEYLRRAAERQRVYAKTEVGKEVQRRAKAKYEAKPEVRARRVQEVLAYHKTEKGAATYARAQARYQASRKGILALRAAQAVSKYRNQRGGTGPIYKVIRKDVARIVFAPCYACGATEDVEIEHFIPIKRGGSHGIGNLLPLCGSCNTSKSNRTWMEWRVSGVAKLPAHLAIPRRAAA